MFQGAHVLVLVPLTSALVIINCVSWTLVRLYGSGLPVKMGLGWPWSFYTYAVNRVGPSEFFFSALLADTGVGLAILLAAFGLVAWVARKKERTGWQ